MIFKLDLEAVTLEVLVGTYENGIALNLKQTGKTILAGNNHIPM